jgi:hypothetical protein
VAPHRISIIDISEPRDATRLVLVDELMQPFEICEASRENILSVVKPKRAGMRTRTEGGALTVSKFRQLGTRRWIRT